MKKTFIALLCCALFSPILTIAQDWNHFTPLQAQAPIPDDLLKLASQQYEEARAKMGLDSLDDDKERKTRDEFLLQTNFVMRELLQSGKVLFNDPLSNYCNLMKDYLLRDNPEAKEKLRIYIVKSPAVNAFATTDGILLVNVGLLAALTNEAQLAFVLCHEIQHYLKQHPINEHVEAQKINTQNPLYRGSSFEDMVLAKNQYSRELETEADELGLELYYTTNFSFAAIDQAYDILQYSHLPFSNVKWDKNFFQTANLIWPEEYWLDSLTPISPRDDFDEVMSTHPSIKDRRANLKEKIGDRSDEGRSLFLFGEERFAEMSKLAQYEKTWLLLDQRHYEECIYSAYVLLKNDPGSYFLKKAIGHALYGLTRYRNEGSFYDVHQDFTEMEGESQQLLHLIDKMKKADLNALAIIWNWEVHKNDANDKEVNLVLDDLFKDFWLKHAEEAKAMKTEPLPTKSGNESNVEIPDSLLLKAKKEIPSEVVRRLELSEWDSDRAIAMNPRQIPGSKAKGKLNIGESDDESNEFLIYGFANYFGSQDFEEKYNQAKEKAEKEQAHSDSLSNMTYAERSKFQRAEMKKADELKKNPINCGLDKVLAFDPIVRMIDNRHRGEIQYLATEQAQEEYKTILLETADKVDLNIELLDRNKLNQDSISRFNDYVLINDWLGEFFANEEVELVNLYKSEIADVSSKYGTDAIMVNGNIVTKQPTRMAYRILVFIGTTIFIVAAPIGFYYLLKPSVSNLYFSIVISFDENKVLMQEWNNSASRNSPERLRSKLFNSLSHIKAKAVQ